MCSTSKDEVKSIMAENVFVPYPILVETLSFLSQHGRRGIECDVHWCGKLINGSKAIVTSCIYPNQHASALGVSVSPSEVAKIYLRLYEKKELLLAQVHSHPGMAFHSSIDDYYPVMHKRGLLSIVVPSYGFLESQYFFSKSAVYEYQSNRLWRKLASDELDTRFKVLPQNFEEKLFSRTKLFASHLNLPFDDLLSKLKISKVAVAIDDELLETHNGQHMLVACVNLLTRACVNIDVFLQNDNVASIRNLPLVDGNLAEGLEKLCLKINPYCRFRLNPSDQKYDVALIIGDKITIKAEQYIFVSADGWLSYIGTRRNPHFRVKKSSRSENPVGPLIAASLGSAEVFKAILKKTLTTSFKPMESLTFSTLDYKVNEICGRNPSLSEKIALEDILLIGSGALGMAVAYTLASLPVVSGKLIVIDPECVDISNLNRYSLAIITDIGLPKVNVIRERLNDKFEVSTFKGPYQQYHNRNIHDLDVVTVDNVKTRRDVQMDFPKVILNAGMYANSFTISRHDDFLNKACLGCIYPLYSEVRPGQDYPAISFTTMFAGVLLASEIIKERVAKLREYRLDNAFMANDVFSPPKIGETYLLGRLFDKSDDCSCHCRSSEVIKAYENSRSKV